MARPVYILCCHSSAIDKATDASSCFEIFDSIQSIELPTIKAGHAIIVRWTPLQVVSSWMIEPDKGDKYEDEFEFRSRMLMPNNSILDLSTDRFSFEGEKKRFYRVITRIESPLDIQGSGVMLAECGIRKVGEPDWISQDYPIMVKQIALGSPKNLPAEPAGTQPNSSNGA